MLQFATQSSVRELKKEIVPEVRAFERKLLDFSQQNEQMKEMIRRFDEIVSDKASKSQLTELEYQIDQAFVKKKYWDKLQNEINETMQ